MAKTGKLLTGLATLLPSPQVKRNTLQHTQRVEPFNHLVRGDIVINLGDRWGVFGVTRSGKTTFVRRLLRKLKESYPQARLYVYDSKWKGGDFEDWPGIIRSADAPDTLKTPGAIQVWQPPVNNRTQIDIWLQRILSDGQPAIIYVDELSSMGGRNGTNYPVGLEMLLKQGAGINIGVIVSSQEVARIPRQVLNQMTHLVRFPINDDYDARVLDRRLGRQKNEERINPSWYSFYYRNVHDGRGKLYLFRDYREMLS